MTPTEILAAPVVIGIAILAAAVVAPLIAAMMVMR